jgi:hypothetical protein
MVETPKKHWQCDPAELPSFPLNVQVPGPDSNANLPAQQQAALVSSVLRTMPLLLGRGAFPLGLSHCFTPSSYRLFYAAACCFFSV